MSIFRKSKAEPKARESTSYTKEAIGKIMQEKINQIEDDKNRAQEQADKASQDLSHRVVRIVERLLGQLVLKENYYVKMARPVDAITGHESFILPDQWELKIPFSSIEPLVNSKELRDLQWFGTSTKIGTTKDFMFGIIPGDGRTNHMALGEMYIYIPCNQFIQKLKEES